MIAFLTLGVAWGSATPAPPFVAEIIFGENNGGGKNENSPMEQSKRRLCDGKVVEFTEINQLPIRLAK